MNAILPLCYTNTGLPRFPHKSPNNSQSDGGGLTDALVQTAVMEAASLPAPLNTTYTRGKLNIDTPAA